MYELARRLTVLLHNYKVTAMMLPRMLPVFTIHPLKPEVDTLKQNNITNKKYLQFPKRNDSVSSSIVFEPILKVPIFNIYVATENNTVSSTVDGVTTSNVSITLPADNW